VTQTYTETQLRPGPQTLFVERTAAVPEPDSLQARAIPYLRLLWERRRLLSRATLIGLLVGMLLAFLLPRNFESRTRLMPPDNKPSVGMAMAAIAAKAGSLTGVAGDVLGPKSSGALFIGILTSATLEYRMVERFGLQKVYWAGLEEDARRKLEERTSIFEDRKSGIITIEVTDRDPQRATAMAQAYVEELDRLVAELSTSAAHRERVFLEERLQAVKHELDQAAQSLSQFESANDAIDIKEQGKSLVDAGAALMGHLIAAESELKGLEQIYAEQNVRVQAVQARIRELRRQLETMRGVNQKEIAGTRELTATDSLYPSIRELPLLGVTYADLYRRAKIKEAVYETLTQEYELARVEEAKETPSVKVLDRARVPQRQSFPPRLQTVSLCALLPLLGAGLVTVGGARWKKIDPSSPGKIFAGEVLAKVNTHMPWNPPPNGSRMHALTHWIWLRMDRRRNSSTNS
jgi:capsule polysaccharide export protein KpsE/RkpR